MIELNKLAKKYNPVEDVVGLELSLMFQNSQIIGDAYYKGEESRKSAKDAIAVLKYHARNETFKRLLRDGWKKEAPPGNLTLIPDLCYFHRHNYKLMVFNSKVDYNKFVEAAEVVRYLMRIGVQPNRADILNLHDIIMLGAKTITTQDGAISVALDAHPEDPEDAPPAMPQGWAQMAVDEINWAANVQVQAAAVDVAAVFNPVDNGGNQ